MFDDATTKMQDFVEVIEDLVWKHDISYMDAVLQYCENSSIEVESIAKYIKNNDMLRSNIEFEAEALNYLPRHNTLPI